ncbi:MAG: ECF transporter S component [Epulopiscium sp. Nuni2H_MBin001]|nr:MAG: ECF transporter S component [Epulopiscium sp. Nuni2H_MBin001]
MPKPIKIILLLMPLTTLLLVDSNNYYFISLLLIIYAMLPFFIIYEKRKVQLRELVMIAVMIAIAVAGRSAFFMLPQIKPMVAIVIISGICLGAQSGFLIGTLSAFISNFIFGQGPWTIWQMFATGSIGFLAGILYYNNILMKTKTSICIFGGITTFFIYGGIVNLNSLMTNNIATIIAYYVYSIPFDLLHASSTIVFLYLIAIPMIEKIERIKTKYG